MYISRNANNKQEIFAKNMREIPECLNRRYKALDELIKDLNTDQARNDNSTDDFGVRLMCDFWNILKEDPNVDLVQAVQNRMEMNRNGLLFGPQQYSCYMAGCKKQEEKKQEPPKHYCGIKPNDNAKGSYSSKSTQPSSPAETLPLNKVLCNLKEVASFEKKCESKVNDLLDRQKLLQDQILKLEEKEKDGISKLKEADCIWSCMEGSYKKKIAESLERQKNLLKQLKEAEASNMKWRKNKRDLEFELDHINKCHAEITGKINEKASDIKCIDIEIDSFKSRIESNKQDIEVAKKSLSTKKQASDARIENIANEVTRLEKILKDEQNYKKIKEQEGNKYVKDARNDLQKLCKVLLKKKLENEDLAAEREALLLEINLLKQTCDQCKEKCKNKQVSINDEIKELDKEIAEFKVKCIKCHQCTDTMDIRKFCTDCPRCLKERDCLYENDQCSPDHAMDCVCMSVKQRFLDNVFDNMYTVLERQIKTGPGKAVAEAVLNCLRRSRNGKLNEETKNILQDFILTTIKKNLNLTIVGGAVKTRCEMDSETYKQLMLCLAQIKVTKAEKIDQGTDSKKLPCQRWKGSSECNCPKGPNECICAIKAPPVVKDLSTCPPEKDDKEDKVTEFNGQKIVCPHKESTACGVDCAMHQPSTVGAEIASWRPNPCQEPTCTFKNMRAAQCVLGPEVLSDIQASIISEDQSSCKCGHSSTATCACDKDSKHLKAVTNKSCDKNTCMPLPSTENNLIDNNLPKEQKTTNTFDSETKLKELRHSKKDIIKNSSQSDKITKYTDTSDKGELESENINIKTKKDSKFDKQEILNKEDSVNKRKYSRTDEREIYKNNESDNEQVVNKTKACVVDVQKPYIDGKLVSKNVDIIKKSGDSKVNIKEPCRDSKVILDNTDVVKKSEGSIVNIQKPYRECCGKHGRLSSTSLTKFILNTKKKIDGVCHKLVTKDRNKFITKDRIYKVKITGIDSNTKEPIFALKPINSNKLEVVLDKEFEEFHRKIIKEYKSDTFEEYANLIKTDSGHFVIDFDTSQQTDTTNRSVLISKTESGNIHLLIENHKSDSPEFISKSRKPSVLKNLLNLLPSTKIGSQETSPRTSRVSKLKSNSESHLYEKVKFNAQQNQDLFVNSSVMLQKTSSDQYTLVLNKESKKSFVNNVKKYLSSSSVGNDSIKVTESGVIIIDVKTIKNNNNRHGFLKITPSGNIYVSLDKDSVKLLSKDAKVLDKVKNCSCKAISTTCNGQCHESFCDKNTCCCNNICYKAKQWTFIDSDTKSSVTSKRGIDEDVDTNNSKILFDVKDKMEKCFHVQSICHHHNNVMKKVSNRGLYNKEHDLDVTIKDNVNYNWNSLEYLPPLLPNFLKDFTCN